MSDIIGKNVRVTDGQSTIIGTVIDIVDEVADYPPYVTVRAAFADVDFELTEKITVEIIEPALWERLDKHPDGVVVSYNDGTQYIKHDEYWYVLGHPRTSADIIESMLSKDSLASLPA